MDSFGDIGGVVVVCLGFGTLLMNPISSHMFTIKALQKLYRAQTEDERLFAKPKGEKIN